jgi:CheY-like chemotaxis protein
MGDEAAADFVLVVDDEEGIRDSLREVVEMGGCAAVVAANGAEAMQVLSSRRPCLVIVDLLMPVMTGGELIEAMRRQPDLADIPVVVSTSAPDRAPRGIPVLPKPIDIQLVWSWMGRCCSCCPPAGP